jgi:hypothetical protein
MSKGILEFTLPEEQPEFDLAVNAGKYHSALWEFSQRLRGLIKHSDVQGTTWDDVRTLFHEVLNDYGVEL